MHETTDAGETTPPPTESVTAGDLNFRARALWPVDGEAVECRVDTVLPVKFEGVPVAYKLFLTGPGGRIEADVAPDELIPRLLPE